MWDSLWVQPRSAKTLGPLDHFAQSVTNFGVQFTMLPRLFDQVVGKLNFARFKDRDRGRSTESKVAFLGSFGDGHACLIGLMNTTNTGGTDLQNQNLPAQITFQNRQCAFVCRQDSNVLAQGNRIDTV